MSFQWVLPTVSEVHDLNNFWIQMKAAEPAEKNMILIIMSLRFLLLFIVVLILYTIFLRLLDLNNK